MGWVPHLKGKIRYVFFALWMPALQASLVEFCFIIFPKAFDPEFLTLRGLMEAAGALEQLESQGLTIPIYILISSIQAVTFIPFLNLFAALDEEVGWRGALYLLFDYVYEKTETIWLPSLMHGATNAFTIFVYLSKPEYADKAILGPAYIDIISMIPMIITAVIICVKQKRN